MASDFHDRGKVRAREALLLRLQEGRVGRGCEGQRLAHLLPKGEGEAEVDWSPLETQEEVLEVVEEEEADAAPRMSEEEARAAQEGDAAFWGLDDEADQ